MRPRDGVEPGVAANVAVSGVAVMCATTVTNPLDVIKVRVQTQSPDLLDGAAYDAHCKAEG